MATQTLVPSKKGVFYPDVRVASGWFRRETALEQVPEINQWVSPCLNVRFEIEYGEELAFYGPDGGRFLTYLEMANRASKAEESLQEAEEEKEEQRRRAERLAAKLRELGVDPDAV